MNRSQFNSVSFLALALFAAGTMVMLSPVLLSNPVDAAAAPPLPLALTNTLGGVLCLTALLMSVSSTVRRLHDLGWSGWWIALTLSPLRILALFAAVLGLVLLAFIRGDTTPNAYDVEPETGAP